VKRRRGDKIIIATAGQNINISKILDKSSGRNIEKRKISGITGLGKAGEGPRGGGRGGGRLCSADSRIGLILRLQLQPFWLKLV